MLAAKNHSNTKLSSYNLIYFKLIKIISLCRAQRQKQSSKFLININIFYYNSGKVQDIQSLTIVPYCINFTSLSFFISFAFYCTILNSFFPLTVYWVNTLGVITTTWARAWVIYSWQFKLNYKASGQVPGYAFLWRVANPRWSFYSYLEQVNTKKNKYTWWLVHYQNLLKPTNQHIFYKKKWIQWAGGFHKLFSQKTRQSTVAFNYLKRSSFQAPRWFMKRQSGSSQYPFFINRVFASHRIQQRKYKLTFYSKHLFLSKLLKPSYLPMTKFRGATRDQTAKSLPLRFFIFDYNSFLNKSRPRYKSLFINMKQRLISKLKRAREVHFKFSTKRTLNKRTYCNFLQKELHQNVTLAKNYKISWILFILRVCHTWQHVNLVLTLEFIKINGEVAKNDVTIGVGDILQLPSGLFMNMIHKNFFLRYRKVIYLYKKLKRIHFVQKKKLWMKRKQRPSKYLQWLNYIGTRWLSTFFFDPLTNTFSIVHSDAFIYQEFLYFLRYSTVLKLYRWRFRP